MEIFLDTCDIDFVRKAAETGLVSGVTTNPSLMKKAGQTDYSRILSEICAINGIKHVSAQVTENAPAEDILKEALRLVLINFDKIVIKLPPTKDGFDAIKLLKPRRIKTNVTLIFSVWHAFAAMKRGADFASPFISRLADGLIQYRIERAIEERGWTNIIDEIDKDKLESLKTEIRQSSEQEVGGAAQILLQNIVALKHMHNFPTKILAASVRSVTQFIDSVGGGADVVSVPPKVFEQVLEKFYTGDQLNLREAGIAQFLEDRKFLK